MAVSSIMQRVLRIVCTIGVGVICTLGVCVGGGGGSFNIMCN